MVGKRFTSWGRTAVVLGLSAAAAQGQTSNFHLSFDGPSRLDGAPGAALQARLTAKLRTTGLRPGDPGAEGWTLSVAAEGCTLTSATTAGTVGADVSQGGLRRNGYEFTEFTRGQGNEGVVSVVILSLIAPVTLDPGGSPHSILAVTVDGRVPEQGTCSPCRVRFRNGLQGSGLPVYNEIGYKLVPVSPVKETKTVQFCLPACPSGSTCGRQRPGDCNQDGRLDISDAICIFGTLFLGHPQRFPCGDGSRNDFGNKVLLSANGDFNVDLSDGIYALQYLFLGGPPHVQGNECLNIVGCPANADCR